LPSWSASKFRKIAPKERLARYMANTKSITDKDERKKVKRAARKKAAPKGPRAGARGENKAKVKKASQALSILLGQER
jgi:hypothetical protein